MNGYAFLEYEDYEDARYAIKKMNGAEVDGRELLVEFSRKDRRAAPGRGVPGGAVRDRRNCLRVLGISNRTGWQELKDWARTAGSIEFADTWLDERGEKYGVIKYDNREDFKRAYAKLDGSKLDGVRVRLQPDDEDDQGSSRGKRSRTPPRRSRSRSRDRERERDAKPDREREREREAEPKREKEEPASARAVSRSPERVARRSRSRSRS